MDISQQDKAHRGYHINALGQASLPPKAFEAAANLLDVLADRVNPRVLARLGRLAEMDKVQHEKRQELLRQLLEATSATSVSFQERVFEESPVEEDVITFSIDEAGEVTILLG